MKRLPDEINRRKRDRRRWQLFRQQDGACLLCGEPMFPQMIGDATFEHMTPRSRGGSDGLRNMALSHRQCNEARGSTPLTEKQRERARQWFGIEPMAKERSARRGSPETVSPRDYPRPMIVSFDEAARRVGAAHDRLDATDQARRDAEFGCGACIDDGPCPHQLGAWP